MNKHFGLGIVVGAVLIAGAWVATYWTAALPAHTDKSVSPASTGAASVRSAEGNLVVNYSVTTSKSQSGETWESGSVDKVTAIAFQPNFIVVQTKEGGGIVFFADRTKTLSWKLKEGG
jgi:hypothetical protein